jgi:3-phosphoshikimate 1-carboxyvinyltransferase
MVQSSSLRPLAARRAGPLSGEVLVPGDKSISHRALILGALAVGESHIEGLLEAEDVVNTAEAMRRLGATVQRDGEGQWRVWGVGVGGFSEPDGVLDFGNSGTGSRLVMGAIATTPITVVFTGDASLRKRPMRRVLEPLELFGAESVARDGGLLPVTLRGAGQALAIEHEVAVASAQVKSALLLAALNAAGRSRISQKTLTRDHTEKMLRAFGADVSVEPLAGGGEAVTVMGETDLRPAHVVVPRDPSSAAFPLAAALLVPGSEVSIPGILLNPRRTGLLETLAEMGADIVIENRRDSGGEEVGDLRVRNSSLKAVEVPPERSASMIDEYPILAVLAAFAEGRTVMRGLEELRVKESDRLSAIVQGLKTCGVGVEELPDGMVIEGRGADGVPGGARIATHLDHRIAMSFLVAGMAAREPVRVDDTRMIATSFPEFEPLMRKLGAQFSVPNS